MSARLSSLLVAGVVMLGSPVGSLLAASSGVESASVLRGASFKSAANGAADLELVIPSYTGKPRIEVLSNPTRIVVDLKGVDRGAELSRKDLAAWTSALILKSRISQFATTPEPVTRLVLEVAPGTQVAVSSSTEGVNISLAPGSGGVQARLVPSLHSTSAPSTAVAAESTVIAKAESVAVAAAPAMSTQPLGSLPDTGGASNLSLPSVTFATLLPAQPGSLAVSDKVPTIMAAQVTRREDARGKTLGDTEARYVGTKMTIDVPSADIKDFLKIIADTAKLNLIVDPEVQGNITTKFTDCPWDLVLDVVLKHAGLGKEINNGVIRVAKVEKLQKEEEDKKKLEEAKALAGDLTTVSRGLSFAKASEAKAIVEKMLSKRGGIMIDERTNTLIISDLPRYLSVIDELIQQLDVQIQQVQIEARVVEAQTGYEKAFGVKWPTSNSGDVNLALGAGSTSAPWTTSNGPSWNSINNRATTGNSAWVGFAPGKDGVTTLANPAGEFWVSFLSNRMSLNVILQALEKDGKIKIVSSPKVVTQNNKKAKILSGEKIPYPVVQSGSNGGAITVQFMDANLSLEVTPQITNDGTILMDLKIEKAEADFSRQVQGTPTILHKSIETQVLVKDGGTAILGGVHVNNTSHQVTGVPFISKLPLIGWLFRSKDDQEKNVELLLFITPRVLKN